MALAKDLTGKKFGRLTVLKFSGHSNGSKKRMWLCQCDCGNQKTVIAERIVSGNTSSCGCARKEFKTSRTRDLSGFKTGRLTALSCVGSRDYNGNKKRRWLCQCDCGKQTIQDASALYNGKRISCGCAKTEASAQNSIKSRHKIVKKDSGFKVVLNSYIRSAKKRNLEWTLTIDEAKDLFEQNCYYCGLIPSNIYKLSFYGFKYSGIDRKDNNKGYILENCVPCCKICNHAKHTISHDDFLGWINKVYLHQKLLNA